MLRKWRGELPESPSLRDGNSAQNDRLDYDAALLFRATNLSEAEFMQ
jgi:hypothetical protein